HAGRSHGARQGDPHGRAVLDRGGAGVRQGRQAPCQRARHLLHGATPTAEELDSNGMAHFTNLGSLIVLDRDPAKVAGLDLGGEEGPREFTYLELDGTANGVARSLVERGLVRGDRIAILSANRAEYLAAYFGIMRA